jgi:hypothetical protein
MEVYLIEVRDMDEQFRTIRRGVRASLETAKSLVSDLIQEYVRKDYTSSPSITNQYEDGSATKHWLLWANNNEKHDLDIALSDGRMDTTEHRLWIPNEDEGKMFESNEEMTEYIINNYNL